MNLAFDIDDVLAAFNRGWFDYNRTHYGTNFTYDDLYSYNYMEVMNLTDDEVFRRIFEFYESPEFLKLEPIDRTQDIVTKLKNGGHILYVITSRPAEIAEITTNWVNNFYPNIFTEILFTGGITREGYSYKVSKGDLCLKYDIHYLIEDAPAYAETVAAINRKAILIEKPWNKTYVPKNENITKIKDITQLPTALV